jgi:hypothetical protein
LGDRRTNLFEKLSPLEWPILMAAVVIVFAVWAVPHGVPSGLRVAAVIALPLSAARAITTKKPISILVCVALFAVAIYFRQWIAVGLVVVVVAVPLFVGAVGYLAGQVMGATYRDDDPR